MENHAEQRAVHFKVTIVFNEAERSYGTSL